MRKSQSSKKYFYRKVVKIPIYFGNFIIIFSNDIEKVKKCVFCEEEIDYLYAHSFHSFLYHGFESFAVCFNFWSNSVITTGTVVHEVNHIGNQILKAREFEPDFDNDEAEAYLKGFLADEIQSFMIKCNLSLGY